jgi:hypothetical protein
MKNPSLFLFGFSFWLMLLVPQDLAFDASQQNTIEQKNGAKHSARSD